MTRPDMMVGKDEFRWANVKTDKRKKIIGCEYSEIFCLNS